jgi:hypothetical protein
VPSPPKGLAAPAPLASSAFQIEKIATFDVVVGE